jgi:hypothetical protein
MEADLKKMMEEIALKKIVRKIPDAEDYKTLIKFRHSENKILMDLDALPADLAKQIDELFQ